MAQRVEAVVGFLGRGSQPDVVDISSNVCLVGNLIYVSTVKEFLRSDNI